MARRVGVAPATVSRWLNGKRVPEWETCYGLADALVVPVDLVLAMTGRQQAEYQDGDREDEDRVVLMYRSLSPDGQRAVREFIEFQRGRKRRES